MIKNKTIEIVEKAKEEFPVTDTIYEAQEMKYVFAQKVIELTLEEAVKAVDRTDLKEKTYTTYDKDNLDFCKSQVKKEIQGILDDPS
jgi:carotenoid cleavage dioxygenase-like enzyme